MELDVTHMVKDADEMPLLSGSRVELGQDAARITWRNALDYAHDNLLLADETALDAARAHFRGYGAWSEDEIAAWSNAELQAITCQEVAAAIREMEAAVDYADYEALCNEGTLSGRLYVGDNGRWYFYIGE